MQVPIYDAGWRAYDMFRGGICCREKFHKVKEVQVTYNIIFKPIIAVCLVAFLSFSAADVAAQEEQSLFGKRVASVTYGPYGRFEMGAANLSLGGGYWLPPGKDDPRIDFDANPLKDRVNFSAIAFGYDWQNGVRADVSIFTTGTSDVTAPCYSASNSTSCSTHSDITDASIKTSGLMGSLFYAPLEARGSNAILQPFVVAGLGLASNKVGEWTRSKNPNNPSIGTGPVRTFEGDTTTDIAWSLGVGASLQVTRPGRWPVIVELALRHYDFGSASGGANPVGSGKQPVQPFTFDNTAQVVTLGIRIPLRRY